MPATRFDLMAYLDELGIVTKTVEHEAFFTVEEGRSLRGPVDGAHSKNLFLKDKKGRLFLVVAEQDTVIDLKRLHERIGASGRVSFGSADQLEAILGVKPGSVTPFAVINDQPATVSVVLDQKLADADLTNFHPLINTATTTIAAADLRTFLIATGHPPLRVDFSESLAKADL